MDSDAILQRIEAVPLRDGRRIIAIAGAPASGKSTLADILVQKLPNACVVPMDGFHRSNDDLAQMGLLARKGAPETFDGEAFVALVRALRSGAEMIFPTFDRARDCVVPEGGHLPGTVETIIVEGNYLLLDRGPWRALGKEWDLSVMIDVPLAVLRERLVARWLRHGLDPAGALARAQQNDIPNAQVVIASSTFAEVIVGSADG